MKLLAIDHLDKRFLSSCTVTALIQNLFSNTEYYCSNTMHQGCNCSLTFKVVGNFCSFSNAKTITSYLYLKIFQWNQGCVIINPFLCHWSLSIPPEKIRNFWFSDIFRGIKRETSGIENGHCATSLPLPSISPLKISFAIK